LADVSTALREIDRAIRTFGPARPICISGRVAFYEDANQRASHFDI
jgi:hypothetical protein